MKFNNSLDLPQSAFKKLLDASSELVLRQFEKVNEQKGFHPHKQKEIENWFAEAVPEHGMDDSQLLDFVEKNILDTATGNLGPHMYAYVMAGGNQMSIVAEKLAVTINQNVGKWHLSPALSEIEKRVIQWASDIIGYREKVGGVMVSGGSAANFTGLTVARNVFFEKNDIRKKGLFGQKPFVVYASTEVHSCIDKSVEALGIGSNQLRKIQTNADFTIDTKALVRQIEEDKRNGYEPFCLIGNAGTVNTGAIDDLAALGEIARQHKLWFHVDGAYGVLVSALRSKKHLYNGLELADSVALDFHKWLYQPFEAGCVLVKDWDLLKRTYFKKASYLDTSLEQDANRLEFNEHNFQLSRNAKALKVWMSIKYYGLSRIREMIQKDIDLTDYLNEQIRKSSDFKLVADSELAISCFQFTGGLKDQNEIISLNKKLIPALEQDGRVFITGTTLGTEFVLRACLINHRKTEATTDFLLQVIREVGHSI